MGEIRGPNGVVLEESDVTSSWCSVTLVGCEVWARAEKSAHEIIRQVQPTVVSEERRRDVVDYVQRLLKRNLGCEVFPFGSVPLKTYLPDGDIDLTAFCRFNLEENFANNVYSVLEREDHNPIEEFVVKDVQYIRAEVKLVKCLVQNIVVDISFNQIGGLCALCFLEEVDRLIGKDHLFKRSIILIKAWCYYESRILGAHHGLISTYALETLVLYIFHLFHSSLSGPLAVLYRFLDYFSKFDWENYCVSLSGPVHVSSLPDILAERPENGGGDLLLSHDFMRDCVGKFSVPSRGTETNSRTFMQKHLNIVDPLKENNNLGRSVSKGNFFRIRSAFSYGARKLGQLLLQPQENIAVEVQKFFTNTLDRHGQGQRPDVQDVMLTAGCNGFVPELLFPGAEVSPEEGYSPEAEFINSNHLFSERRVACEDTRPVLVSNVGESGSCFEETAVEQGDLENSFHSSISSAAGPFKDGISSSFSHLSGDANDIATRGIRDLRITCDVDNSFHSVDDEAKLPVGYAPHLCLSHQLENGKMENGDLVENGPRDYSLAGTQVFTGRHHACCKDSSCTLQGQENRHLCSNNDLLTSTSFSPMAIDSRCWHDSHSPSSDTLSTAVGCQEMLSLLPDLSGDVKSHLDSLQFGQWWYGCDHFLATSPLPIHLPPPPFFQRKNQWDPYGQAVHLRQDVVPHANVKGVVPRPAFFTLNSPIVTGAAFVDEMPKARGTGTYFPITNHQSYRDRSSVARGRNQGPLKSPRPNGRAPTPSDGRPQAQSPVRQGKGKPRCSDFYGNSPRGKVFKEMNGFVPPSEKADKFGFLGQPIIETTLAEGESNSPPDSSPPGSHNGESVFVVNNDRLAVQSFHLKDEEDFPPLSA